MSFHQQKEIGEPKVNFLNRKFIGDPFPVYKEMRKKDPVHRFLMPDGHYAWIVTTYKHAEEVLNDSPVSVCHGLPATN